MHARFFVLVATLWLAAPVAQAQNVAYHDYATAYATYASGQHALALQYLRPLADGGDPQAQALLGWMYAHGEGVAHDIAQACRWYELAALKGNAWAQTLLGVQYERGEGVERSDTQAVYWYRRAAEQGNSGGRNNLAWMYLRGRGVDMDIMRGLRLFFCDDCTHLF